MLVGLFYPERENDANILEIVDCYKCFMSLSYLHILKGSHAIKDEMTRAANEKCESNVAEPSSTLVPKRQATKLKLQLSQQVI